MARPKETIPENVKRNSGPLDTPFRIRQFATRVANHVLKKEINTHQGSCINGLCQTMLKTFEWDYHERIMKLEKKIRKYKRKKKKYA